MESVAALAFERQQRLIQVTDVARSRALLAWRGMDFNNLDASWASVGPQVTQHASSAQLELAKGADRFNHRVAANTDDFTPVKAAIVPEAFTGVDGNGRNVSGILYGAVTTTKEAIGAGLGRVQSLESGATYLAAVFKTVVADLSRSADLVSAAGKGFTHYVRVCNGAACSRCAALSGISSGEEAFLRHVSCQCTAVAVYTSEGSKLPSGLHADPQSFFDALSEGEQDTVFGKAGAEAIRSGAEVTKVVTARRGANGIGVSHRLPNRPGEHAVMSKVTVGFRPDGKPVQVYATTEGATRKGVFGKGNPVGRVRLMPESIMEIAGPDLGVRQAFLRDAGYLDYIPPHGYDSAGKWIQQLNQMRANDRVLVDRATKRYGNFYLS
jgi:hypothetical protein